jgi:hypothetical protein
LNIWRFSRFPNCLFEIYVRCKLFSTFFRVQHMLLDMTIRVRFSAYLCQFRNNCNLFKGLLTSRNEKLLANFHNDLRPLKLLFFFFLIAYCIRAAASLTRAIRPVIIIFSVSGGLTIAGVSVSLSRCKGVLRFSRFDGGSQTYFHFFSSFVSCVVPSSIVDFFCRIVT